MDLINFSTMPFGTGFDMGHVFTRLNELIGVGSWFDSLTVQNTMWLSVVEKILMNLNSEQMVSACVGSYPAYVAGILKQAVEINFYVLSNKCLRYLEYIEKVASSEQCIVSVMCEKDHFTLSYGEETVLLKFETRIMNGKLPSVITYAHDMLRSLVLCSIAYAIVCNNERIKYITSEVLTSKHDGLYCQRTTYCKWFKSVYYEDYNYLNRIPKRLAGCKYLNSKNSLKHHYMNELYWHKLFCTKKFHRRCRLQECDCKLCVKVGTASLKSQCINILGPIITAEQRP